MKQLEILATLWPEMPHYTYFAKDDRISAIRLNTAMADVVTLPGLLKQAIDQSYGTPLYFDIKGRQLRITEVLPNEEHLECRLNHPVSVKTPTPVLFKAGADGALLDHIEEDGYKLVFRGGPKFNLLPGESLHIRHPSLVVGGALFTEQQLAFIEAAKNAGINKYMLSYAGNNAEIEEFRKHVGTAEIIAKIEDKKGLDFVNTSYKKTKNTGLLTARGDLFVEVDRPHEILQATKDIIKADPDAIVGSRLLLSVTEEAVPSCADLNEMAWLIDQNYYRFMFCDGLCLKKESLDRAINILSAVYNAIEEEQNKPMYTKFGIPFKK